MKLTSNYKLKKPDGNDVVNIQDLNDNSDKIDLEIKKVNSSLKDCTKNIDQLSNPNLLINKEFKINQRNQEIYNKANNYTVDRWISFYNPTIKVINDGIQINSGTEGNGGIRQYFEDNFFNNYGNQDITLSIKTRNINGNWLLGLYIWNIETDKNVFEPQPKTINSSGVHSITFKLPENINTYKSRVTFLFYSQERNKICEVNYAKLELGSVATPFVPRSYGEELALCQRYYFRNRWFSTRIANFGSGIITTQSYRYPATMRITPTVRPLIDKQVQAIRTMDYSVNIVNPSVEQIKPRQSGIINEEMIDFQFDSNLEVKDYNLEIKDYAYEFDSEIY
ncbi:hypothetical protein [Clostridium taeniosporum]|uniref:Uncharacterized protein n=1 Tax=Clostridium taeniosporum TaxID=394958 RepID=A0A1D7XI51_9CLOT|nr:hypothetical protein [Clostridium taeniosporum]AOR23018.1 hypothetical protein BGI42_04480 [Clostridium taeniosporum]